MSSVCGVWYRKMGRLDVACITVEQLLTNEKHQHHYVSQSTAIKISLQRKVYFDVLSSI